MAAYLPAACHQCGGTVTVADRWVIEHVKPRATHPELTWVRSNWAISDRRCSDASGAGAARDRAYRHGYRAGAAGRDPETGAGAAARPRAVDRAPVGLRRRERGSSFSGPGGQTAHAPERISPGAED